MVWFIIVLLSVWFGVSLLLLEKTTPGAQMLRRNVLIGAITNLIAVLVHYSRKILALAFIPRLA